MVADDRPTPYFRMEDVVHTLNELDDWCHEFGRALVPSGSNTYGEGVRDSKDAVRRILARLYQKGVERSEEPALGTKEPVER